jgi:predicted transcriptional regulator
MMTKNQALYMLGVYKILSSHKYRYVLKLIEDSGEINVSTITLKMQFNSSETSFILSKMKRFQLVNTNRVGNFVYYSINKETFEELGVMKSYFEKLKIK